MNQAYVLVRTGENEEIFKGDRALDRVLAAARDYFAKGFQVEITRRPTLTSREERRDREHAFDPEVLLARAKNGIENILVPADVLVGLIGRLRSVETMAYAKWASPRGESRQESGCAWATIQQMERMGKDYFGSEFSALLGTTGLLRTLFERVRDGDLEGAQSLAGSLDGGERQEQTDLVLVRRLLDKIGRLYHEECRDLVDPEPERYTYIWVAGEIGPAWVVFEFNSRGKLKAIDAEMRAPESLTT